MPLQADHVALLQTPASTGWFAGRLEKDHLGRPQTLVLAAIGGLEGDFRDWDEVRGRANEIAEQCVSVLHHAAHAS